MQSKPIVVALTATILGLPSAFAQDNTTTAPESAEEAVTPTPGETYLAEEHGAWELRCMAVEEGPEPCQLYQVLNDEGGGAVAEIVVFPLPDGEEAAAGAIVTTPLETLLTEQVAISVDGNDGRLYPFSFCAEQGCVARIGLTPEDLNGFRRGNEARVRIVPARAPDREVILTASLSGFTAGFTAIGVRSGN
ncbi:MAG: invasion associated locus B family protein [Pseudomonadota bacterium]